MHQPAEPLPVRRDRRRVLPTDQEGEFRRVYPMLTLAELARSFGMSTTTAWREARRLGLPRRNVR